MSSYKNAHTHTITTIAGSGGYGLKARYWACSEPTALVVIVHGVVSHSLWLESISVRLAAEHIACLAVDRRGAGLNKIARGDAPSESALLEDLDAVIDWACGQGLPVHLCGFCWGANYVVNYLSLDGTGLVRPGLAPPGQARRNIISMILLAPSLFPSQWMRQQPFKVGECGEPSEEPVMPIDRFTDGPYFESFIKPDRLRVRKISLRMNRCMQSFSAGLWMKFLQLTLPCLVLLGEQDDVVDNIATQKVFDRLRVKKKQLHLLPARHGIQFDAPDLAASHIAGWVSHVQSH